MGLAPKTAAAVDRLLERDPLFEPETVLSEEASRELFRSLVLLRSVDCLFVELGRSGRVPFAWTSWGLEAVQVGVAAALAPADWLYPDLRTGGMALLRGLELDEHVQQLLGTGKDRALGRRLPGLGGFIEGRVVPLTASLGTRIQQALGTAWAARRTNAEGLAACVLGPSELERPETLDVLERALTLRAPLLGIIVAPKNGTDRWMWMLADHDVPAALTDDAELLSVLATTRKLAARCRAERTPCVVVCEEKRTDPLERFAQHLTSTGALSAAVQSEIRQEVHAELRQALVGALGQGRAHLVYSALEARAALGSH